jgi:hypothetical protein
MFLLEGPTRCGIEVIFLRNPVDCSLEAELLLQVQGTIPECKLPR